MRFNELQILIFASSSLRGFCPPRRCICPSSFGTRDPQISDPLPAINKGKKKNTYFFQFYRVFPEFPFLHARLVMFTELDASVFGFSLSDHL